MVRTAVRVQRKIKVQVEILCDLQERVKRKGLWLKWIADSAETPQGSLSIGSFDSIAMVFGSRYVRGLGCCPDFHIFGAKPNTIQAALGYKWWWAHVECAIYFQTATTTVVLRSRRQHDEYHRVLQALLKKLHKCSKKFRLHEVGKARFGLPCKFLRLLGKICSTRRSQTSWQDPEQSHLLSGRLVELSRRLPGF